MTEEAAGGRVFFSDTGRTLAEEDQICILSVGVDIGSSTSHLVFSRIVLERLDSRYIVSEREAFFESDIILTPYASADTIDAEALGRFLERQYADANVDPDEIDTGALILTGVAVQRSNARRIGELFARQVGKMVAVSAGDSLETTMAAYGSGAVARSISTRASVMNVDVGGGTSKIAICSDGRVIDVTAIEVGARLICVEEEGRIVRLEDAGRRFADALGIPLELGALLRPADAEAIAGRMADCLFDAMRGEAPSLAGRSLLRIPPLSARSAVRMLTFSGGVSEYIHGRQSASFGDLGPQLAAAIRVRAQNWDAQVEPAAARIRATVIGASQYTTQVSGSTIYVSPLDILPLRNLPVIAPKLNLHHSLIDAAAVSAAIRGVLARLDLITTDTPVALFLPWRGSASFARLDACCRGVIAGLATVLASGRPLVLIGDGDVGGLIGIHCREELKIENAIVSVDGLELKEFDYIDIGRMLDTSGAVPVVIKSLVFPQAPGRAELPTAEQQPRVELEMQQGRE
jgi:ethanolamine utilization protein EutA (predicted chaperonin)